MQRNEPTRLMPIASPSPPSSFSMKRGRTVTTMPTKENIASVGKATIAKGAMI